MRLLLAILFLIRIAVDKLIALVQRKVKETKRKPHDGGDLL